MNQNSLWPAMAIMAVAAMAVAISDHLFNKHISKDSRGLDPGKRHLALNGLRGLVILAVFLHHATIYHGFLRTGLWQTSASYLQVHLGIHKVFVLFMLSGYLFTTKLLNAKNNPSQPFNWKLFYVSRLLRLTPLYFFVLLLVIIVIAVATDFTQSEPIGTLLKNILAWASFTLFGSPFINGFNLTPIAGVVWSLPYEWFFYLLLPILAFAINTPPKWPYLCLGVASAIALYLWQPLWGFMSGFAYGTLIAFLCKQSKLVKICNQKLGTFVALASVVTATVAFPSGLHIGSQIFIFIAVTCAACGNNFLGLLKLRVFQSIGERSYSVYLLHSLVLYIAFKFLLGDQQAMSLTGAEHWLLISLCTVVLVPLSYFSYHWIERPFQGMAPKLVAWTDTKLSFKLKPNVDSKPA